MNQNLFLIFVVIFSIKNFIQMNYLDYKELEKTTLETKNVDAICYLLDVGGKIINSKINSYKYKHSDLNDEERKQLYKLNNLNDDDVLIGGEIHRVVGDVETKKLVLKKVDEIELFTIMEQIRLIKTNS